jgi:hypothetical protein
VPIPRAGLCRPATFVTSSIWQRGQIVSGIIVKSEKRHQTVTRR